VRATVLATREGAPAGAVRERGLIAQLLALAGPVWAEQALHMMVGLNDTFLANHLPDQGKRAAATAAVGTVSYVLWFIGLIVGAVGTGSTAIIARAKGARHRGLANSVCGQSVTASIILGLVIGLVMVAGARVWVGMTALGHPADEFALRYLRMLGWSLPFTTVMLIAAACLRGAGDTLTPAVVMIILDVVNMFFSVGLTYGWWGMPALGFDGIAIGTIIAYVFGGVLQFAVLVWGRGGLRLYLHRMRPHWLTLKRVMRIGVPSGLEGLLTWVAQFGIVVLINAMDPTSQMAAAHINAVRIEALSYLSGYAFATAAATMVGHALGRRDEHGATRAAYAAYAVGGGIMTACGVLFILFSRWPAGWMSANAHIADLTAKCLMLAGFAQFGFAASMIFSGALRGAGDTLAVMVINLASIIGVRLMGVLIVGWWLGKGLVGIWCVLCTELVIRGALIYGRFAGGRWKRVRV